MNAPAATLLCCLWAMPLLAQTPQPLPSNNTATGSGPASADDLLFKLDQKQITVSLKLEKTTVMLGEPIFFGFVVKNASEQQLWVLQGGDYRNALGRPESFKVSVLDAQGKQVPQPDSGPQMGGMMGFQSLPAHGEKSFDLFLPHWAKFERPGHYSIQAERVLILNSRNLCEDIPIPQKKEKHTVDIQASATAEIDVIPTDQAQLGKTIDELGEQIVALPPNHMSDPVSHAIEKLRAIHDERTIPWFLKMLKKKDYEMKIYALWALEKYNNHDAFDGLKAGLNTTSADCHNSQNIVNAAAQSLNASPCPEALPFLLTQYQHPDAQVRLTVTHALGHKVPKEKAIPMLEIMARDTYPVVSSEAKRYLKELQGSETAK